MMLFEDAEKSSDWICVFSSNILEVNFTVPFVRLKSKSGNAFWRLSILSKPSSGILSII